MKKGTVTLPRDAQLKLKIGWLLDLSVIIGCKLKNPSLFSSQSMHHPMPKHYHVFCRHNTLQSSSDNNVKKTQLSFNIIYIYIYNCKFLTSKKFCPFGNKNKA